MYIKWQKSLFANRDLTRHTMKIMWTKPGGGGQLRYPSVHMHVQRF